MCIGVRVLSVAPRLHFQAPFGEFKGRNCKDEDSKQRHFDTLLHSPDRSTYDCNPLHSICVALGRFIPSRQSYRRTSFHSRT